jgi:methylphosphotriester-DNA--protein-cysteine methyltransferase
MPRPKKGQEHPHEGMADRISLLAAIGTTHDHIARICDMSTATLHKHYKDMTDAELASIARSRSAGVAKPKDGAPKPH